MSDGLNLNNGDYEEPIKEKSLIKDQLAKLIDLKSIITLSALIVFMVLALRGDESLPAKDAFSVILMTFTFFLGFKIGKKVDDK